MEVTCRDNNGYISSIIASTTMRKDQPSTGRFELDSHADTLSLYWLKPVFKYLGGLLCRPSLI